MVDFLKNVIEQERAALGRVLTSWVYTPKKSNRFLLYAVPEISGVILTNGRTLHHLESLPPNAPEYIA